VAALPVLTIVTRNNIFKLRSLPRAEVTNSQSVLVTMVLLGFVLLASFFLRDEIEVVL
jgi:hypothetical protein